MAEVLGSAEVEVLYQSKQGQLRREVDSEVRKVESTVDGPRLNVRAGGTNVLRGELDDLAKSSRGGALGMNVLDESMLGAAGSSTLLTAGVAAGAAALAGAIALANQGIDTYVGLADAIREVTERTGASADEASRIVAVTDDYSISSTTAANSLFFLGRAISLNEEKLTQIGVTIARNRDGSTNLTETLANVAERYASTADAGKRAELVQTALGRSGRELIPILEQGGDALRRMFEETPEGQLLSQEDLDRAREFQLATDNLSDVWQEFTTEIGRELVPALADLIDFLAEAARTVNDLAEPVGGLVGLLAAVDPTGVLKGAVAWRQYKDATDGASDSTDDLRGSLDDLTQQVDDAYRVALDLIDAEAGQTRARFAMQDANDRVTQAQERLNEAVTRGGKFREDEAEAVDKVRKAEAALIEARQRAIKAEDDRVEAVDAVSEAEFRFGRQSREANEARDDLRDKTFEVENANRRVIESTDDLNEAQSDLTEKQRAGGRTSQEAAKAQRDLERALFDQQETARKAAEQQVKVADAQAAVNGETLTANERLGIYRGKLSEIEQAAAPGSPLRIALQGLRTDLQAISDVAAPNWLAGGGDWGGPATLGSLQGPGAVTPGGLSGGSGATGAGGLAGPGGTAAGVSSLSGGPVVQIDNLNVNNNVDAAMLPYDIAWQAGGGR